MASWLKCLVLTGLLLSAGGCATGANPAARPFAETDRFCFRNELRWTYSFDDQGNRASTRKTLPPPDYDLHCFPMVRAAREFFYHAHFDPALPPLDEAGYRRLVKALVRRDSRRPSPPENKITIPGFENLMAFSAAYEPLLKELCGSALASYTQRGNWRMILPFSQRHQARTAARLIQQLDRGLLPIIHLADFPALTVNHALLVLSATENAHRTTFELYDPNEPTRNAMLAFDPATRRFHFERNNYFAGGVVDVYEVYKNALF